MTEKYKWSDVAGTAKKWLRNKVTETTTADRRTRRDAEASDSALEKKMKDEAAGAALVTAFPSLGRALEHQEQNKARAAQESTDRQRAKRAASVVPGSSIELSGHVNGRLDDVAVDLTPDADNGTLTVLMEPVDPGRVQGGEVLAAGFAISGFKGEGRYELVGSIESLDPGVHHVALGEGNEDSWFYWTEEYGPGVAVVRDGMIETSLVCRNSGSQEIRVTMRVPLG